MMEEYTTDEKGLVVQQGTWDYKIPTVDTIPKQFHVEILNTGHHKNRVLSSKGTPLRSDSWVYNLLLDTSFDNSNRFHSIGWAAFATSGLGSLCNEISH